MQTIIHNQLSDVDYDKVASTVEYYSSKHLNKYETSDRWKLEAWCKEGDGRAREDVSCGISLRRPGRNEIFVKKDSDDFKNAAHSCVLSIEKIIRRES